MEVIQAKEPKLVRPAPGAPGRIDRIMDEDLHPDDLALSFGVRIVTVLMSIPLPSLAGSDGFGIPCLPETLSFTHASNVTNGQDARSRRNSSTDTAGRPSRNPRSSARTTASKMEQPSLFWTREKWT